MPYLWKPLLNKNENHAVLTCCNSTTSSEWVTLISLLTSADCIVIDHFTLSIYPTCTWAWITTLFTDAGQVTGTFTVDSALWSTVGWSAHIARQTRASGYVLLSSALSKWTTWIWITWVNGDWRCCCSDCFYKYKYVKKISIWIKDRKKVFIFNEWANLL